VHLYWTQRSDLAWSGVVLCDRIKLQWWVMSKKFEIAADCFVTDNDMTEFSRTAHCYTWMKANWKALTIQNLSKNFPFQFLWRLNNFTNDMNDVVLKREIKTMPSFIALSVMLADFCNNFTMGHEFRPILSFVQWTVLWHLCKVQCYLILTFSSGMSGVNVTSARRIGIMCQKWKICFIA
jgi:hypothetical protein